jgi:membrane protein required for colicin V production
MSLFDFFIIFVIGICFIYSFSKGMVREIFSLLGYLVGYVLAMDYYEEFATALQSMVSQEIMARISDFAIVFTVVKILVGLFIIFIVKITFGLLGRLIRKSVEGTLAISFLDRIVGGALGVLKGLVIVAIIMFPLGLFSGGYEKVTQGSIIAPYLEKIISLVSQESYVDEFLDFSSEISVDEVQEKIKKMSDLNAITQDIKNKKEEFLGTIQEGIKNKPEEGAMENYTKEDKNKLNDLLETFSTK